MMAVIEEVHGAVKSTFFVHLPAAEANGSKFFFLALPLIFPVSDNVHSSETRRMTVHVCTIYSEHPTKHVDINATVCGHLPVTKLPKYVLLQSTEVHFTGMGVQLVLF